jgi:hypothetical protein
MYCIVRDDEARPWRRRSFRAEPIASFGAWFRSAMFARPVGGTPKTSGSFRNHHAAYTIVNPPKKTQDRSVVFAAEDPLNSTFPCKA